jgi:hypothetical protein
MEKEKNIEEYCESLDFHVKVNGNVYCILRMKKEIECRHISQQSDENNKNLYKCLNPRFYKT